MVLHVGRRDAVTVRDNGTVEFMSASPVEGASESVSADEDDEVLNIFESLDGAFKGLLLEGSKSEIKAWLSGRPVDPLRKGYCNPLVAEDLTGRLTQALSLPR